MKKEVICISALLLLTGCGQSNLVQNETKKVEIETSIDQKAVYSYIKKAQAHLSVATNYKPEKHEEKILMMASESFQLPVTDVALIYTAYEYGE